MHIVSEMTKVCGEVTLIISKKMGKRNAITEDRTEFHNFFSKAATNILNTSLEPEQKKNLLKSIYSNYMEEFGKNTKSGKGSISKSSKELLEKVYATKQWLTKEERELVAKRCQITPLQVRIWFINKRSRSK
ncbi:hypothetical protein KAFR_0G00180 [Kazachstania africana CBS 2517]|uniref:Homeobox domain-containing protein n=1 Tax=Kazachstania africana (strain ATCC 22294 / BCRC 22015 / CBS 2517 / CECT 1963 / NBRC 1671 / NRRL Y-8276) TaxID=1071382 RepID=H2AXF1_KAZAF|nr:hypothetical protein KAFR_0G00180 [Kazachstania africana CBS 2517]CCF59051.1 hypothetical protein KAFR_0G00180 [Kazachstania africana CBS 2517]